MDVLGRTLYEADRTSPEMAASVGAGALSTTSTATLELVFNKTLAWAKEARASDVLAKVASALVERGATGQLEALLEAAPRHLEPVRAAILTSRAKAGQLDFALSGLEQLDDPELSDRVRSAVVSALVRAGRIREVQAQVDNFSDERLRDAALAELAGAQARAGRVRESQAVVVAIRSSHQRALAEAAIARAEQSRGRSRAALKRARRIESKLVRAQTLADLAAKAGRAGRRARARRLFERALAEAETVDDPLLQGEALAHIALRLEASCHAWPDDGGMCGQVRMGKAKRALPTREERQAPSILARLPPNLRAQVQARRVERWVKRGRLDRARTDLAQIQGPGLVLSEAQAAVAVLEARSGAVASALERIAQIVVPGIRWRSLGQVAGLASTERLTPEGLASIRSSLRPGL